MFPTLPAHFHSSLEDLQTYSPNFVALLAYNQLNQLLATCFNKNASKVLPLREIFENYWLLEYPQQSTHEDKDKLENVCKVLLFIYRSAYEFYRKQVSDEQHADESSQQQPINMSHFVTHLRQITQLSKEWLQVIIAPFHENITREDIVQAETATQYSAKMVRSIEYRASLNVASSEHQDADNAGEQKLAIMIWLHLQDGTKQVLKIDSFKQLQELEKVFANIERNMGID